MTVGVIFLSLAATPELRVMTQKAVNSCISSDPDIKFKVLVCEGIPGIKYAGAKVINPSTEKPFNYNEYMNTCRSHYMFEGCDYIALCNNDLLFGKDWATNLIKKMKEKDALSACPMEPTIHAHVKFEDGVSEGYNVTVRDRHVAGWCIFQDMSIYSITGDLNTECSFWHSDVIYSMQLKENAIRHILVEEAKVHHLTSQTLNSHVINDQQREVLTYGQDKNLVAFQATQNN